jgi:transposase
MATSAYTLMGAEIPPRPWTLPISPVIPQLATEKTLRLMDWGLYLERNVVERLVGKLKEYRRIATRYDKLAASYLAFVQLAAIRMWL